MGGNDSINGGGGWDDLDGGSGADSISGETGNDLIYGDSGDDQLTGDKEDDFIDGGEGENDSAVYSGIENEYDFKFNENGTLAITDSINSRDGSDLLVNIEYLQFKNSRIKVASLPGGPNDPPYSLTLNSLIFDENIASNSLIANLSTLDPDPEDIHAYSLVGGDGDTDNSSFTISGDQLKIIESPDYETKSAYSVRLQTKDSEGLTFDKSFTFTVNDLNEAPTDISVSATNYDENLKEDSTVATLNTSDTDSGETFGYSLVGGDGDTDNSSFTISGDQLKIIESPDYETKSAYSVRLQTKDSEGLTFDKSFTFTVNDLNEAPTLIK